MKRRTLIAILIGIMLALTVAGCGQPVTVTADDEEIEEEETESKTEKKKKENKKKDDKKGEDDNTDKKETSDPESEPESKKDILSIGQCEDMIDRLKKGESVHPENEEALMEMADCATFSGVINKAGVLFAEMDDKGRARLHYRFLGSVTIANSPIHEELAVELDDGSWGIAVEDAERLLKDAYGEKEYTPGENEYVKDGYVVIEFGDGEPVDLIEPMVFYEDAGYILVTGPVIYESNGEGELFKCCADILFEKNPDSRFGATLLYGRYYDSSVKIASVEASSELSGQNGKSYSASNLIDGDPSTVWVEGVTGTGVGETITIHLDGLQPVYGIQFVNGYTADYDLYEKNGTVSAVEVDFGSGVYATGEYLEGYGYENMTPEDLASLNRVKVGLDRAVVTNTIVIKITDAVKGAKYDDTCISEVWVYGPGD